MQVSRNVYDRLLSVAESARRRVNRQPKIIQNQGNIVRVMAIETLQQTAKIILKLDDNKPAWFYNLLTSLTAHRNPNNAMLFTLPLTNEGNDNEILSDILKFLNRKTPLYYGFSCPEWVSTLNLRLSNYLMDYQTDFMGA